MNTCWALRRASPAAGCRRMYWPSAEPILVAQLAGEARHHAKWRELGEDEETAAVAKFRALAGGRAG